LSTRKSGKTAETKQKHTVFRARYLWILRKGGGTGNRLTPDQQTGRGAEKITRLEPGGGVFVTGKGRGRERSTRKGGGGGEKNGTWGGKNRLPKAIRQ